MKPDLTITSANQKISVNLEGIEDLDFRKEKVH
jgi:hypothetical protein